MYKFVKPLFTIMYTNDFFYAVSPGKTIKKLKGQCRLGIVNLITFCYGIIFLKRLFYVVELCNNEISKMSPCQFIFN